MIDEHLPSDAPGAVPTHVLSWDEFCRLLLSRRPLDRLNAAYERGHGLLDVETGERFVVDERTVPPGW